MHARAWFAALLCCAVVAGQAPPVATFRVIQIGDSVGATFVLAVEDGVLLEGVSFSSVRDALSAAVGIQQGIEASFSTSSHAQRIAGVSVLARLPAGGPPIAFSAEQYQDTHRAREAIAEILDIVGDATFVMDTDVSENGHVFELASTEDGIQMGYRRNGIQCEHLYESKQMLMQAVVAAFEEGDTIVDGIEANEPRTHHRRLEAMVHQNRPEIFQLAHLSVNFFEMERENWNGGEVDRAPWPGSYWPTLEDGVNSRWANRHYDDPDYTCSSNVDCMSPLEKYDMAFNDWRPEHSWFSYTPYDSRHCINQLRGPPRFSWHDAYYTELGKAAHWNTFRGHGTGNLVCHDRRDNSGDFTPDDCDNGGCEYYFGGSQRSVSGAQVLRWFGLCHAWAPASIMYPEPKSTVRVNGVPFHVADIKALLLLHKFDSVMVGTPCSLSSGAVPRDFSGRIMQSSCRDANAGAVHILLANMVGREHRPLIMDVTWDGQTWNHPVLSFETETEVVSNSRDACSWLGTCGFSGAYPYNRAATQWVKVTGNVKYIIETNAANAPRLSWLGNLTHEMPLEYLLELDATGDIVGGEWRSTMRNRFPDFLWISTGVSADDEPMTNPHVNAKHITQLLRWSRRSVQAPDADPEYEMVSPDDPDVERYNEDVPARTFSPGTSRGNAFTNWFSRWMNMATRSRASETSAAEEAPYRVGDYVDREQLYERDATASAATDDTDSIGATAMSTAQTIFEATSPVLSWAADVKAEEVVVMNPGGWDDDVTVLRYSSESDNASVIDVNEHLVVWQASVDATLHPLLPDETQCSDDVVDNQTNSVCPPVDAEYFLQLDHGISRVLFEVQRDEQHVHVTTNALNNCPAEGTWRLSLVRRLVEEVATEDGGTRLIARHNEIVGAVNRWELKLADMPQ